MTIKFSLLSAQQSWNRVRLVLLALDDIWMTFSTKEVKQSPFSPSSMVERSHLILPLKYKNIIRYLYKILFYIDIWQIVTAIGPLSPKIGNVKKIFSSYFIRVFRSMHVLKELVQTTTVGWNARDQWWRIITLINLCN